MRYILFFLAFVLFAAGLQNEIKISNKDRMRDKNILFRHLFNTVIVTGTRQTVQLKAKYATVTETKIPNEFEIFTRDAQLKTDTLYVLLEKKIIHRAAFKYEEFPLPTLQLGEMTGKKSAVSLESLKKARTLYLIPDPADCCGCNFTIESFELSISDKNWKKTAEIDNKGAKLGPEALKAIGNAQKGGMIGIAGVKIKSTKCGEGFVAGVAARIN